MDNNVASANVLVAAFLLRDCRFGVDTSDDDVEHIKYSRMYSSDAVYKSNQALLLQPLPRLQVFREYKATHLRKAIVTINTDRIAPDDVPHHPFDITTERPVFQRESCGIAINSCTEQIYVTDHRSHTILIFGADGEYQRTFGCEGTLPGQFKRPTGIAYDAARNHIIVADHGNHRVQVLDATSGQWLLTFGSHGSQLSQFQCPWGVAISSDGSLIAVSDSKNSRVQFFKPDGQLYSCCYLNYHLDLTEAHVASKKSTPRGLAFDKQGAFLYVSDFTTHQILRVHIQSRRYEVFVNVFEGPSGIALDNAGNILVCDSGNNRILAFRSNGGFLGLVSSIGGSAIQTPLDVAVFPAGYIALLDFNGRIRIF